MAKEFRSLCLLTLSCKIGLYLNLTFLIKSKVVTLPYFYLLNFSHVVSEEPKLHNLVSCWLSIVISSKIITLHQFIIFTSTLSFRMFQHMEKCTSFRMMFTNIFDVSSEQWK
uniref:hypothetical protein n=1 Tax=Cutaneotrichosporon cutaneum TaxID=5554 RepID=UPI00226C7693|nr:hypothetical protein OYW64_mgp21 [Cutaneotrichosporon cutaneum]UZC57744.1 hypothetical protein [Cutaneotrichosporon cutaneum]